jgi:signal transduction histidine kinase
MISNIPAIDPNLARLFQEYETEVRVRNYRMCGILASVFMMAGCTLDGIVYGKDGVLDFLPARLFTAAFIIFIWFVLDTSWGKHLHRLLGMCMGIPLVLAIGYMIKERGGADSPYYAGFSLIMLGAGILMRWTLTDSVLVVIVSLVVYLVACRLHGPIQSQSIFLSNLYFLTVTGVFTTAGTWYYNLMRLSEFRARHALDQSKRAIEDANNMLGEANARLAVANIQLSDNNQKLREMDEIKSRFFANISHELRTPLTLLIAPLETMISRFQQTELPQQEIELLGTMHSNAMRLLKLINDLLDLVRLESGTLRIQAQPLEMNGFVRGIASSVQTVADDKHIHLYSYVDRDLDTIVTDSDKLERICLNLLFNALKFTAAGGEVRFNAYLEDPQTLIMQVKDTGVGIAAEHLPHLFSRFWQADSSSQRKYQGLGIGLALVKELTEALGGEITPESELGKGTTMTVKLPLNLELPESMPHADEAAAKLPPARTKSEVDDEPITGLFRRAELFPAIPPLHAMLRPIEIDVGRRHDGKLKLLIADDEPDMLRFLKGQLSPTFEVLEAVDGRQAVEKASQFLPDIILCDMMMPEMDGLQVCRELRDRTPTRVIPLVLLTARADEKTKLDCLEAGASDFIAKPFSMTEVAVRLRNLAEARLQQKELFIQKQRLEAALDQIKETESLLVRNEKLASLGRMSAGLIHEINNPLNYSSQGLQLMREAMPKLPDADRSRYTEILEDVENGVTRVTRIVADLRSFTRGNMMESSQVFQAEPMVKTTARFFAHEFKDGIDFSMDVPEDVLIRADSSQITQVLINLIQNAIDAMREKSYPAGERPTLSIHAEVNEQGYIQLIVKDNGPGVPEDIVHQIFDPFFTTKDVGAGMGLGLSICHRIMEEHGGRIEVRSQRQQGTVFTLHFPPIETAKEPQTPKAALAA